VMAITKTRIPIPRYETEVIRLIERMPYGLFVPELTGEAT